MSVKLMGMLIMLGFAAIIKIGEGILNIGDHFKKNPMEIPDWAKGADEDETAGKVEKEKTEKVGAEKVEAIEEETMAAENNAKEEAVTPEDLDDKEEVLADVQTWKCPQCGKINPTYQYACICGNRFR